MYKPAIIVHGGVRRLIGDEKESVEEGLKAAARLAYEGLTQGGAAMDAVVAAVSSMEDHHDFNAGSRSGQNVGVHANRSWDCCDIYMRPQWLRPLFWCGYSGFSILSEFTRVTLRLKSSIHLTIYGAVVLWIYLIIHSIRVHSMSTHC